jgi:hypothetical protein
MRGSFTCCKVGTWDRLFNFPSEGRQAEDFYIEKNPAASAGFEPANLGTRGQHANHQTTEAVESGGVRYLMLCDKVRIPIPR